MLGSSRPLSIDCWGHFLVPRTLWKGICPLPSNFELTFGKPRRGQRCLECFDCFGTLLRRLEIFCVRGLLLCTALLRANCQKVALNSFMLRYDRCFVYVNTSPNAVDTVTPADVSVSKRLHIHPVCHSSRELV